VQVNAGAKSGPERRIDQRNEEEHSPPPQGDEARVLKPMQTADCHNRAPRIVTPVDTRFRLATVRHSRVNMADFRGSEAELPVSEAMRTSGNFRRLRRRVLGSQLAWKFAVSMKFPPFPGVVLEEQK
jgi:hypothetical protein